jgi:PAS domain S-box-containing protein
MSSGKIKPVSVLPYILLFLAISIGSILLCAFYYRNQQKNLIDANLQELATITDMKVRQITQWRSERIGDGTFLSQNEIINKQFSDFLRNSKDKNLRDELRSELMTLTENYDYKNALFIDRDLKVRLFYPSKDTVIGNFLKPKLPYILERKEVVLTDLHYTGKVSFRHLDLVVPLREHGIKDSTIIGLLLLRIDPNLVLFPLIQSWPVNSPTSESLIFSHDNDSISYVSGLKYFTDATLNLKKPLNDENQAASLAVRGYVQASDALDYRGVHVIASMKKVPESSWFLLAKTDKQEIVDKLQLQLRSIIIINILMIMASFLLCGAIFWQHRLRFYRSVLSSELDKQALARHYDFILKYANDLIFLLDSDSIIIEANDKALERYNYSRSEMIGKKITMLLADSFQEKFTVFRNLIDKNGFALFEVLHKQKDGTEFPVEVSVRKVDIEGITYYQSIERDITERKQSEEILRESEERFRKTFDDSPIGMIMTGKDLVILRANETICRMIGYPESILHGMTMEDFTHPDYIPGDKVSLLKLVAGEIAVYRAEKRFIRDDGSLIWASTSVSLIRNNSGEVQYYLAMVEDITLRKKAEKELVTAKEKAEESDRLKTAFLHNVSHEIRTPMNAIIGFTTLITEDETTEDEKRQYIDIIFQSGSQLLSIINDIIDLASIETGQVKVKAVMVNLNTLMQRIYEQFSYKIVQGSVDLEYVVPYASEKTEISTDYTKLVQVLSNLINNAFKFTSKGKILFGYSLKETYVEFYVKDSGIGISEDNLNKIFDRFFQVDNATSRQYTGTGLGLAISKAYVELMGGRIWVNSRPQNGTEFFFTIPMSV